jgi:hypothetical protein
MKKIIKTKHIFNKGFEITLSHFDSQPYPHAFEVSDIATGGNRYYVEGGLVIKDDILQEYDGVVSLPRGVVFALHQEGIGFAPYVIPDSLFM